VDQSPAITTHAKVCDGSITHFKRLQTLFFSILACSRFVCVVSMLVNVAYFYQDNYVALSRYPAFATLYTAQLLRMSTTLYRPREVQSTLSAKMHWDYYNRRRIPTKDADTATPLLILAWRTSQTSLQRVSYPRPQPPATYPPVIIITLSTPNLPQHFSSSNPLFLCFFLNFSAFQQKKPCASGRNLPIPTYRTTNSHASSCCR